MILNGHPGVKYGVPLPVLARSAFGIRGSVIPSLLRGLVACGWFGIQTWVGAQSIHKVSVQRKNSKSISKRKDARERGGAGITSENLKESTFFSLYFIHIKSK